VHTTKRGWFALMQPKQRSKAKTNVPGRLNQGAT
jgi:hypothetical protein